MTSHLFWKKGTLLLSSFFLLYSQLALVSLAKDKNKDLPLNVPPATEDQNSKINEIILMQASQTTDNSGVPLGDGDLIEIRVSDLPELSDVKTRITPSGKILLPLLGQLQVEGLTAEELHDLLKTKLGEKYLKNPQVSVSVAEMKSHKVSVMGAVFKPGVYDMTNQLRLVDALGLAGGLREDASTTIYLIRSPKKVVGHLNLSKTKEEDSNSKENETTENKETTLPVKKAVPVVNPVKPFIVEIDLNELIDGKTDRTNVLLYPGDVIQVPPAGSIYVGGEVKNPKGVPIKGTILTAYQAIIEAGGPNDKADMSKVKI